MKKDHLIQNYTIALFNNARIDNIEDKIFEEITTISYIIKNSFKIKEFLSSPIVNKIDKMQQVNSFVKATRASKIVQNFLLLLVKNSRISILPQIVEAYKKSLYESKNIKIVQVISASKLQPQEQRWIKSKIEGQLKQEVELIFDIDPTIIGGVVIKYDNVLQDYSIKGSLNTIVKILKNVKIAV